MQNALAGIPALASFSAPSWQSKQEIPRTVWASWLKGRGSGGGAGNTARIRLQEVANVHRPSATAARRTARPGSRHEIQDAHGLEGMPEPEFEDAESRDRILFKGEPDVKGRALGDFPPKACRIKAHAVVLLPGEGIDRIKSIGTSDRKHDVRMEIPRNVAPQGPEMGRIGVPVIRGEADRNPLDRPLHQPGDDLHPLEVVVVRGLHSVPDERAGGEGRIDGEEISEALRRPRDEVHIRLESH